MPIAKESKWWYFFLIGFRKSCHYFLKNNKLEKQRHWSHKIAYGKKANEESIVIDTSLINIKIYYKIRWGESCNTLALGYSIIPIK